MEDSAPLLSQDPALTNFRIAWMISLTSSLFFFYTIFQMSMLNTLSMQIMTKYAVTSVQLGNLASFFFYANALVLLPAGLLLDHCSKRKCLLGTMGLTVLGSILFAAFNSWSIAIISRALAGIGSGFSLLGCLRLAGDWFPARRHAQVMGFMVTLGLFGGVVAQTPLTLLMAKTSWHVALWTNVVIGVFFWLLMCFFLKDNPQETIQRSELTLLKQLGLLIKNKQNWFCGIYASLLNLPITLLGALWGNLYLQHGREFSATQASLITSMIFLGIMTGSPVIGWISDRWRSRRVPMIVGALVACFTITLIIYLPQLSFSEGIMLFFVLGFLSGVQVICYPAVMESNPVRLASTAVSIVSLWVNSVPALAQPFFGWLVDRYASHGQVVSYRIAMSSLLMAFACSVIVSLLLRETRCMAQSASRSPSTPEKSL